VRLTTVTAPSWPGQSYLEQREPENSLYYVSEMTYSHESLGFRCRLYFTPNPNIMFVRKNAAEHSVSKAILTGISTPKNL